MLQQLISLYILMFVCFCISIRLFMIKIWVPAQNFLVNDNSNFFLLNYRYSFNIFKYVIYIVLVFLKYSLLFYIVLSFCTYISTFVLYGSNSDFFLNIYFPFEFIFWGFYFVFCNQLNYWFFKKIYAWKISFFNGKSIYLNNAFLSYIILCFLKSINTIKYILFIIIKYFLLLYCIMNMLSLIIIVTKFPYIINFFLIGILIVYLFRESPLILCVGGVGGATTLGLLLLCLCIPKLVAKQDIVWNWGTWFEFGNIKINWLFRLDGVSAVMCFVILLISGIVQWYSFWYFTYRKDLVCFYFYLLFFMIFMLILVLADNFVVLFLGWEGVGICSYLLIGFWSQRLYALQAATKALFVNKVGDFFLLIAILLILKLTKSTDIHYVFFQIEEKKYLYFSFFGITLSIITVICFCLLIGAFGKSAQLGLHVWLPDAMEGPTPASALIHAATMVTAGVYLVIRCSPIFELCPAALNCLVLVGTLTAAITAMCAVVETDIKKVVAYSTCSQLGYMFVACGFSGYHIALFHLFNHAFFKALLFLCAGSIIHSLSNEQNLMRMGGLKRLLPLTYCSMLVGLLSLSAFPFSSGYFSKELILALAICSHGPIATFAYIMGLFTAFLTSFYSYRLLYYIFFAECCVSKAVMLRIEKESYMLLFPFIFLSFFSIFGGAWFKTWFVGYKLDIFEKVLKISPEKLEFIVMVESMEFQYKILPFLCTIIGWGVITPVFFDSFLRVHCLWLYNFLKTGCGFNFLYSIFFNFLLYWFYRMYCVVEFIIVGLISARGFSALFLWISRHVSTLHNGSLVAYSCTVFSSFLLLWVFSEYWNA